MKRNYYILTITQSGDAFISEMRDAEIGMFNERWVCAGGGCMRHLAETDYIFTDRDKCHQAKYTFTQAILRDSLKKIVKLASQYLSEEEQAQDDKYDKAKEVYMMLLGMAEEWSNLPEPRDAAEEILKVGKNAVFEECQEQLCSADNLKKLQK